MKLKKSFIILNEKGLHARPAAELLKCISFFKSKVFLHCRGIRIHVKACADVLMFAADKGTKIDIDAEGVDAEEAIRAVIKLSKNHFKIRY